MLRLLNVASNLYALTQSPVRVFILRRHRRIKIWPTLRGRSN
jgi:hypothetical protein